MIDAALLDDPDTFVAGLPLELLARLREDDPVHWLPHRRGGGRYVVTSYRFVREFNRDWRQFSSSQLAVSGGEGEHRGQGSITLLEFDPPDHTALRLLVNRGFTPRAIRRLEDSAHRIAGELVDGFLANGGGDAAEMLAAQLPLQVTGEMLGIPVSDRADILAWTNTTIGAFDPEMCPSMDDARTAMANFAAYGQAHIARRRAEPGDDVFSGLVHAEHEGRRLTDEELGGWWQLLVTGSTETTRNLLSSGLMLLLDHPDQAAALVGDESLLDGAIDEMLRLVTPVMHHQRRVTSPMEHESGGCIRTRPDRGPVDDGGQPRPRGVRQPRRLRHPPRRQRPPVARLRRPPLLPGRQPGPHRGPGLFQRPGPPPTPPRAVRPRSQAPHHPLQQPQTPAGGGEINRSPVGLQPRQRGGSLDRAMR